MHKELKKFMRGLTQSQAAYILGVDSATVSQWILHRDPPALALTIIELFFLTSEDVQAALIQEAKKACPRKGARIY